MVRYIESTSIQEKIEEELFAEKELNTNYGLLSEFQVKINTLISEKREPQTKVIFSDNCSNYTIVNDYELTEKGIDDEQFIAIMEYLYEKYPDINVYSWNDEKIAFLFYNLEMSTYKTVLLELEFKYFDKSILEVYKQAVIKHFYSRLIIDSKTFPLIINFYYENAKKEDLDGLSNKELNCLFSKLTIEEKRMLLGHLSSRRFYEVQSPSEFLETVKQLEMINRKK